MVKWHTNRCCQSAVWCWSIGLCHSIMVRNCAIGEVGRENKASLCGRLLFPRCGRVGMEAGADDYETMPFEYVSWVGEFPIF
jgi:hypothetical protein